MSAANWSDRYANTAELCDMLAAINGTGQAVAALRMAEAIVSATGADVSRHTLHTTSGAFSLRELADTLDSLADLHAKRGNYPAFVVLTDGAAALREYMP